MAIARKALPVSPTLPAGVATPATPAAAPAPARLAYPRAQDRIVTRANIIFLHAVSAAIVLALAWAALTRIDRVTRGPGRVVPQSQNQMVQHLEGGIVTEILVKEGEKVTQGQALMRVENTFFRSDLAQSRIDLKAKLIKHARLDAEVSGAETIQLDPAIMGDLPDVVLGEQAYFDKRRERVKGEADILSEQMRQKQIELSELRSRKPAVEREKEITEERFASLQRLTKIGAASSSDLLEAERLMQQSLTRMSDLAHDIPRTEVALTEIERRKADVTRKFRAEAEAERTTTLVEITKLKESIAAMQERIRRQDVVAPIDGTVNKLFVATVGGVVKGGEPLAQIVPSDSSIIVEMRLAPADRAELWPGQDAIVKVSAYEFSSHGGLPARVIDISSDAFQDDRSQPPYFRVRLEADGKGFGPDKPVVPGMTADVDVISGRLSVLDYLLRPVRRLADNAFRR